MNHKDLAAQLRETCQTSGVRWAVWTRYVDQGWMFGLNYRLTRLRRSSLDSFLKQPREATWLAGAFSSGRIRWRQSGAHAQSLGCQRIYAFPNKKSRQVLLVGVTTLPKASEAFFKVLAISSPVDDIDLDDKRRQGIDQSGLGGRMPALPFGFELEASFDPEEALQHVLKYLVDFIPCDAALLSTRSGDIFRIEAVWNYPAFLKGAIIATSDDGVLARMIETQRGLILNDVTAELASQSQHQLSAASLTGIDPDTPIGSWMGLPIVIGKSVIGHLAFTSVQTKVFNPEHLHLVSLQAGRLANAVENAIVIGEAARYMQQMALLNELASVASLGANINDVAQRVMQRLRRIFRTELAGVFLLSPDGRTLREYGDDGGTHPSPRIPIDAILVGTVVEKGVPVRIGDARSTTFLLEKDPQVRSALAVPLKHRGNVIGALALESVEYNAFSSQDEQLLVVIASQLAGLLENMRLNEELRERARYLQDSVRRLQVVRETALDIAEDLDFDAMLKRVVHQARELVDARGAELGLLDDARQVIKVVVSEAPWFDAQGEEIPLMAGVAGRVAAFGEPLVIADYNAWSGRLYPQRVASFKTVAGIPLKFQGQVVGTLTVMDDRPEKNFRPEDVQLLELLAPQVTVWIRNARLYQELQERIDAQHLAENRLVRSARLAAVGEMAAGVAHELNNPLTTVIGFVELAIGEIPEGSTLRSDLELVLKESQRAREVVRRLLEFSRPSENQRIRTDINELVEDVLNLVHHLTVTGGIQVSIDLCDELPWVSVDPAQIKQVLLNLVHNSIQAMSGGGELIIKTGHSRQDNVEWLTISVSDTGVGIASENMERIFEPFFTTRPAGQGTGLGLSVSYGIVTDHGGYIEAQSQPGKGSHFTVYLPLDKPV
jgi:signal transduction histidine kinase/uncharacterized protein YigA (DUF484 family)